MVTDKDWDLIAKINDTDLYGLLNIMLKELGEEENVTDALNQLKNAFDECYQEENDDVHELTLMNAEGHILVLEGTVKQIEAFEAERKERNDAMFPRAMSFMSTLSLALEHGLSTKKVTLNKKQEK